MTQTITSKKISHQASTSIVGELSNLLANTYALYLKTQNYHWNVTGPTFHSLHGLFEEQYKELAEAVDEIAERIRAIGSVAPGSFSEFSSRAKVKDGVGDISSKEMIANLASDHQTLAKIASGVRETSEEKGDFVSADLATGRIATHQKAEWMLKSHQSHHMS